VEQNARELGAGIAGHARDGDAQRVGGGVSQ
jgi:hypothetical protein